jgi:hypothetical protein
MDSALKWKLYGITMNSGVLQQSQYSFSSLLCLTWIPYVFSLAALNSLTTFSYTTNVREAAGRFFSRLDVMPL